MTRLIVDFLRRHWAACLAGLATLTLLWMASARDSNAARIAMVPSLVLASIGAILALVHTAPNVAFLLPVSRREMWRARWIVGVGGPAIVVVGAAVLAVVATRALGSTRPANLDMLPLVVVYVIALAGAVFVFPIVMSRPRLGARWKAMDTSLDVSGALVFAFAPAWGALVGFQAPTTWQAMGRGTGLALGAAVAVAFASYFFAPRFTPRPGMRVPLPAAAPSRRRHRLFWTDNVTGLRRIVIRECAWSAIAGAILLLLLAFESTSLWLTTGFDASLMFFWLAASVNTIRPLARQLKTLPISSVRLAAFLTALPPLRWVGFLAARFAIVIFLGVPGVTLWQSGILGLVGLSALGDSTIWRRSTVTAAGHSSGPSLVGLVVFLPVVVLWNILERTSPGAGFLIWTVVGLAALAAAMFLNYRTFTRNHRAFQVRPTV